MMFLARIIHGRDEPIVTEVCGEEWVLSGSTYIVKRPRQPWARQVLEKGVVIGAAALSFTPAGAIASAKVVLEEELLKQKGRTHACKPRSLIDT